MGINMPSNASKALAVSLSSITGDDLDSQSVSLTPAGYTYKVCIHTCIFEADWHCVGKNYISHTSKKENLGLNSQLRPVQ